MWQIYYKLHLPYTVFYSGELNMNKGVDIALENEMLLYILKIKITKTSYIYTIS